MQKRSSPQVIYNAENKNITIHVNNLASIEENSSMQRPDSLPEYAINQVTSEVLESREDQQNTVARSRCGTMCCKIWNCLWLWRIIFIIAAAIFIYLFIYVRRPVHTILNVLYQHSFVTLLPNWACIVPEHFILLRFFYSIYSNTYIPVCKIFSYVLYKLWSLSCISSSIVSRMFPYLVSSIFQLLDPHQWISVWHVAAMVAHFHSRFSIEL